MRRVAATLAALSLAGCSGAGGGGGSGTPTAVLLVTLDDARPERVVPAVAPVLSGLPAQEDALAASTESLPALASLLTGLPVRRHGLRAPADPGRPRLPASCETLAERFAREGRATAAAVAARDLRPVGLARGFEAWVEPGHEDPTWLPAAELLARAGDAFGGALAGPRPAFLWVHLADLREAAPPPAPEEILRLLRHEPGEDPAADLEGLHAALGRRRGGPGWEALREAVYDARLAALDRALGELLARVRSAAGETTVVVVGTRGAYLVEPRPDGALEGFSEALLCVPLRTSSGLSTADPPSAGAVAALLGLDDLNADLRPPPKEGGVREVDSPRARGRGLVGAEWKRVDAPGQTLVVRRRDERAFERAALPEGAEAAVAALDAAARASASGLRVEWSGAGALGVLVRSPTGTLHALSLDEGEPVPVRNPALARSALPAPASSGEATVLFAESLEPEPTLAVELTAEGALTEVDVAVDGVPLAASTVPLLDGGDGAPWEVEEGAAPPWTVDVAEDGRRWRVVVAPAEPAREVWVYAARLPMKGGALVGRAGAGARLRSDPALPDALVASGGAPLDLSIERGAGERLALAVFVDGVRVPAARQRRAGRRPAAGPLELLLPGWLPARRDWFVGAGPGATGTAAEAAATGASATISLRRADSAPALEGPLAPAHGEPGRPRSSGEDG